MFDSKTPILAVLVFSTCVVVIWRSKVNTIDRFCLEDNVTTDGQSVKGNVLPLIIDMNDSALNSSASTTVITKIKRDYRNGRKIPLDYFLRERPVVKTTTGVIEGKTLKTFGSPVFAFLGIPFAEPPIGDLRFGLPVPKRRWNGIFKAMNFSYMCPQKVLPKRLVPMKYISETISEDCLTLNVWTPDVRPKALRTVMVWIHGGAFNYNSANLYDTDGRVLSTYGDVVVVSINYRNGALGFLNAQTASAPGNMGIYDQSLGLNWVKDNIIGFGGDPNKIVPFGQSAGAISIGILMTLNSTKNLFSRAITASGGALMPGLMTSKSVQNGEKYAKLVGCAQNRDYKTNADKVIQCLKKVPLNQLIEAQGRFLESSNIAFSPSPNGFFPLKPPANLLNDSTLFSNMKELLTGLVPNEGAWLMHVISPQIFKRHTFPQMRTLDESRDMFNWFLSEKVGIARRYTQLIAGAMMTGPYSDTPINNMNRLSAAVGDNSIICPTIYMADELSARNKTVFMYLFDHKSNATKFGDWQGVSHYEEVPFVFGYPLRRTKLYSKQDIELSKRIMKIWSHFAKTGKVLPQLGLNWQKYDYTDESYMVLKANKSSIMKSFHERSCEIFKASFKIFNIL